MPPARETETDRVRRIQDKEAPRYDRQMGFCERVLFGGGREWACSQVQGEVLGARRARALGRGDGAALGSEGAHAVSDLSHLDDSGAARMVDVGGKQSSERRASAEAQVRMSPETAAAVERGNGPKGDVIGTARLAGIQAAKRAAELIPLAHPLPLTFVDVEARISAAEGLVVLNAEARTVAQTGVDMEAMTACAVAALTVYDMVKGLERGATIERVRLLEKSGGRSGTWHSGDAEATDETNEA